jgi:hypothetical protein
MYRTAAAFLLSSVMWFAPAMAANIQVLDDRPQFTASKVAEEDAAQISADLDRVVVTYPTGQTTFLPKGTPTAFTAPQAVVVQLKDVKIAPFPNTSGFPDAFPRPGVKKLLENGRVTVWDYTWTKGVPTPMHFHSKQVVVVYFGNGTLRSTAKDGKISDTMVHDGLVTFNAPNRIHTETLTDGTTRAVIVEMN